MEGSGLVSPGHVNCIEGLGLQGEWHRANMGMAWAWNEPRMGLAWTWHVDGMGLTWGLAWG